MIGIADRLILNMMPLADVRVIEFQKRCLPHCHMLIILNDDQDKIWKRQQIDENVSVAMPERQEPLLRKLVRYLMIHGPCGPYCPTFPYTVNGQCQKYFLDAFREGTVENIEGYHVYKKRNNCKTILIGNYHVDNRNLVPFNKYLLKSYQTHINFEVCPSVKSIKYIF